MSFAIKPGTPGWAHVDEGSIPDGWIRVGQEPPRDGVWDEKQQLIREKTSEELTIEQKARNDILKRAVLKSQIVDAIVDSLLAGKVPSDPVMADVAAKVAAAAVVAAIDPVRIDKP